MPIQFFIEDVDLILTEQGTIADWINKVAKSHGYSILNLNYIFCSDEYLLEINKKYLEHNYYTDIITFDNSDKEMIIESDVFISVDRVKDNAQSQKAQFLNELNRVVIHGLLHLMGYNDKSQEEKKRMTEKEDACLSLLFK